MHIASTSGLTPSGVSSLSDVEPLFLELDPLAFAGGHVGRQRDHRVAHRHLGMAAGLILRGRVADAPGPVLQFLGVAAADLRPPPALAAAVGRAAGLGVERRAAGRRTTLTLLARPAP